MRAVERRRLGRLLEQFLRERGARVVSETRGFRADLPTTVGTLYVSFFDGRPIAEINGRFADVEAARRVLPHGYGDRLNPYSGKWNFAFDAAWTAEAAFAHWRRELERYGLVRPAEAPGAVP